MHRSSMAALVAAALCFCSAHLAEADDSAPGEAVRFSYQAPEGCPDREAFVGMVNRRGVSLTSSDDPTARAMSISIDESTAWHGRFTIVDGPDESARNVSGTSCDDVARSLSIFVSLAVGKRTRPATEAPNLPIGPSGFVPVTSAPPPEPPELDMLKGRFNVGLSMGDLTSGARGTDAFDGGLRLAYYPTSWLGLGVEGDFFRSFADQEHDPRGDVLGYVEVVPFRFHTGTIERWRPYEEIYFRAAAGAIWTRPTPQFARDRDYNATPSADIDVGVGFRVFTGSWFALSAETNLTFYSENTAAPNDPITGRAEGWYGDRELVTGLRTGLVLTFFSSKPTPQNDARVDPRDDLR